MLVFLEIAHTGVIQSFDEFVAILPAVSFNFGCYDRLDGGVEGFGDFKSVIVCLLYTSDAADDLLCVDFGGRGIIKKKH